MTRTTSTLYTERPHLDGHQSAPWDVNLHYILWWHLALTSPSCAHAPSRPCYRHIFWLFNCANQVMLQRRLSMRWGFKPMIFPQGSFRFQWHMCIDYCTSLTSGLPQAPIISSTDFSSLSYNRSSQCFFYRTRLSHGPTCPTVSSSPLMMSKPSFGHSVWLYITSLSHSSDRWPCVPLVWHSPTFFW